MRRLVLVLLLIGIFSVVGCSNDEEESPTPEKEEETEQSDETTWKEPPPHVFGDSENGGNFMAIRDTYCWGEEDGEACTRTPKHPSETTEGIRAMVVSKGEKINYSINIMPGSLPNPNQMVVTQFYLNEEEGEVIGSVEHDWVGEFEAPEEGGRYHYIIHAKWDGEVVGEAYYAFSMIVKE
ncbi:hypothetical protein [Ornithinibacillus halophilus]|uniref:YtkA-like n=1 Tax=Ornithinibacillus halophilus TaxID=930117 RepID=A0A1M5DVU0_9BACI|nr:hypothetical protein [Ornithinibacillus halophilus]SHF71065.1 hypothetical protein SAMN05216225_100324 [Ornithinibacillus halophilus]